MILVTHSILSVVVTKPLENNWLIFFAAFFTHFVFDMLPHYHYKVDAFKEALPGKNRLKTLVLRLKTPSFLKIFADYFSAVVLPLVLFWGGGFNDFLPVFLAVSGALMPDLLSGISYAFPKNKILAFVYIFHYKVHLGMGHLLDDRPVFGMSLNIAYTLAALYFVKF